VDNNEIIMGKACVGVMDFGDFKEISGWQRENRKIA